MKKNKNTILINMIYESVDKMGRENFIKLILPNIDMQLKVYEFMKNSITSILDGKSNLCSIELHDNVCLYIGWMQYIKEGVEVNEKAYRKGNSILYAKFGPKVAYTNDFDFVPNFIKTETKKEFGIWWPISSIEECSSMAHTFVSTGNILYQWLKDGTLEVSKDNKYELMNACYKAINLVLCNEMEGYH